MDIERVLKRLFFPEVLCGELEVEKDEYHSSSFQDVYDCVDERGNYVFIVFIEGDICTINSYIRDYHYSEKFELRSFMRQVKKIRSAYRGERLR